MPSGERLPGVLWPWAGSRRMSMALWGDSSGIPLEMPGRAGHDVTKVMKSCRERNNRE